MSEYLSRNQFGPILATIDAVHDDRMLFRLATDEDHTNCVDVQQTTCGTETYVQLNLPLRDKVQIFRWLADEVLRLDTIRKTSAINQEALARPTETLKQLVEQLKSALKVIGDLDNASFHVGLKEMGQGKQ